MSNDVIRAKRIKLSNGLFALVDDADFKTLSTYSWVANKSYRQWRAQRNATAEERLNGLPGKILMHRQIMGFPDSEIDHRNRNALDNRRSNLRLATHAQNMANSRTRPHGRLRGVRPHHDPNCSRFEARIRGRYLGLFLTADAAGRAYDAAAIAEFGEFAVLNFERSAA